MIKNLKRSDIQDTPFVATKPQVLSSFNKDNLLILEQSASLGIEIPIALEFIDYGMGDESPFVNKSCNLALEQQDENKVIYEEGVKYTGIFYPSSDPVNPTGTYKRLVYNQIRNAFYNTYQDPTKMFGLEHIDFQLSKTKKFLTDRFRLFSITRDFFGEKMLENSIILVDNSLDDSYLIVDDGYGNIVAKENLFSKIQEVRYFGNNVEISGSAERICEDVVQTTTTTTPTTTTTTTTPTTTTTTTTSTTTSTTPPPGPTTTTTTSTSTTTTSTTSTTTPAPLTTTTTSTTTSTTSTTTPAPLTTTTTTTATTSAPISQTTTTTTTVAPPVTTTTTTIGPVCDMEYDCYSFTDEFGNPIPIETVHWKRYDPSCGCVCAVSNCNKFDVCQYIFGFGITDGDRDENGRLLTTRVHSKPGSSDCKENCVCGSEGCQSEPDPGNDNCCKEGGGQNRPSAWDACWLPVLDILALSGCIEYNWYTEDTTCDDNGENCCDTNSVVTIKWLF